MHLLLLASFCVYVAAEGEHLFHRWEKRTVDCQTSGRTDDCTLIAPKAIPPRDPAKYKCRREPMPHEDWNPHAKDSPTRLVCPIGCEPEADLSVLTKIPANNTKCVKYYTYGKIRRDGEWYLWMTEPCVGVQLTTHCRFSDVKQYGGVVVTPEDEKKKKRV